MRTARPVEADGGDGAGAGRAVGADQRAFELRAVTGEPAGHRDRGADLLHDAGDQFAAIDRQSVGEDEDAGKPVIGERAADGAAACA
ncbi:MAG: hypothetical protein M5U33_09995 [Pseudorhodoplanes sp.]|nr:hypothetical protein [Pseudorhodoplanes sp.]